MDRVPYPPGFAMDLMLAGLGIGAVVGATLIAIIWYVNR